MEDMLSPAPQPEDPERSRDPASEEDPDIKVELIDGVFHQLSMDNALVAITADYPGLYPASQVIATEVLTPSFLPCLFLTTVYDGAVQEAPLGREAAVRWLANKGQSGPVGGRGARHGLKRRRKGVAHNSLFRATFLGSV